MNRQPRDNTSTIPTYTTWIAGLVHSFTTVIRSKVKSCIHSGSRAGLADVALARASYNKNGSMKPAQIVAGEIATMTCNHNNLFTSMRTAMLAVMRMLVRIGAATPAAMLAVRAHRGAPRTPGKARARDDVVFNAQGRPMAGATVRICTASATGQPCSLSCAHLFRSGHDAGAGQSAFYFRVGKLQFLRRAGPVHD